MSRPFLARVYCHFTVSGNTARRKGIRQKSFLFNDDRHRVPCNLVGDLFHCAIVRTLTSTTLRSCMGAERMVRFWAAVLSAGCYMVGTTLKVRNDHPVLSRPLGAIRRFGA